MFKIEKKVDLRHDKRFSLKIIVTKLTIGAIVYDASNENTVNIIEGIFCILYDLKQKYRKDKYSLIYNIYICIV